MKKIFTASVWLSFLVTGTVLAQDPNGPDSLYLQTGQYQIAPGGGDLEVQIWLKTDNTLDKDKVTAFQIPSVWSSTNPQAQAKFDPNRPENQASASGVFSNSAITNWGIFIALTDSINQKVELAAVCTTSSGLLSGSHLLATLTFTLSDTTTICLDTTQNMSRSLLFVTSQGFGYVPRFYSGCFSAELNPPNTPPHFVAVPDTVIMSTGVLNQVIVTAADSDSDSVYFSFQITPTPASSPALVDSGNGTAVMVWVPNPQDTGTYTIEWTVSDGSDFAQDSTVVIVNSQPPDQVAADVNCDGVVSLADVMVVINYLFRGIPLPDCQAH